MEAICSELSKLLGADFVAAGVIPAIFRSNDEVVRNAVVDLAIRLIAKFPIKYMSKEQIFSFKQQMKDK